MLQIAERPSAHLYTRQVSAGGGVALEVGQRRRQWSHVLRGRWSLLTQAVTRLLLISSLSQIWIDQAIAFIPSDRPGKPALTSRPRPSSREQLIMTDEPL